MDLICPPRQCDTCQSGHEHLNGRRHDDTRRQVIPYPNGRRKEAVSGGINRPDWNAESAAVSSRALCVWTEVEWCWYRNLTMNYPVHHNGSGLSPAFLQRAPSQLLHHYGWTSSSSTRCWSSLRMRSAPVIYYRSCCTTLHWFETIDVVCCMGTPDCGGILQLWSHERCIGCCRYFPWRASGVPVDLDELAFLLMLLICSL